MSDASNAAERVADAVTDALRDSGLVVQCGCDEGVCDRYMKDPPTLGLVIEQTDGDDLFLLRASIVRAIKDALVKP